MITLELAEVEIDYCTECGGIWLDSGELEQLLQDPQQAREVLDSFKIESGSAEKPRRCPICLRKMKKIIVDQSGPTLRLDKCARGHGLWFDKGELQDILGRARLDKDNKIPKLLAEMFGEKLNAQKQ